ncbi:hypothetical protein NYR55_11915 [Sphingomonas sp. BGYR3]|uniref:hypothetical protein n=1 Tax=Sphingomonas sp. BGYR3 TaxID=2975483 RepID=UPI0021A4EC50|nr:hypothetical protein [Sphingomonas sp. BGYR3]MDG5489321.1 hypothetical protein [Sphingomonas sp. BGYR3]
MLLVLALLAQTAAPDCTHDRAALLALPQQAFDQDMDGGWRALANRGCDAQAADLIRDWRTRHGAKDLILIWHEGQMRANIGQTDAAIALFDQSRKPADEDAPFGWNHYVDGSIAFLRRNRPALERARAQLAVLPRPEWYKPVDREGRPQPVQWPMNLHVLDGFLACWDRPYAEAYGCGILSRAKPS